MYNGDIPLPVNGSYLTPTHFPFPYQLHPQINFVDYPFHFSHLIVKYTCGHYLTLSPVSSSPLLPTPITQIIHFLMKFNMNFHVIVIILIHELW